MKHAFPLIATLLPALTLAQSPSPSRIDEVLIYPGGAQVTRLATVAAGARELVLNCLSARFDPDSLQIDAPAGVNLGPVQLETLPRERVPECANSPLDEQVRKLEAQRDQLTAESSALDTSLGYLKALQVALSLGLDAPMTLETPLMFIDKAATWRLAEQLGGEALVKLIVDETHTCYLGERGELHAWGHGCGHCPACALRARGYAQYRADGA